MQAVVELNSCASRAQRPSRQSVEEGQPTVTHSNLRGGPSQMNQNKSGGGDNQEVRQHNGGMGTLAPMSSRVLTECSSSQSKVVNELSGCSPRAHLTRAKKIGSGRLRVFQRRYRSFDPGPWSHLHLHRTI